MRCKHNSPRPQLGSGRHLVCLSIIRPAEEPSRVSNKTEKCPPQLPRQPQPAELLHAELLITAYHREGPKLQPALEALQLTEERGWEIKAAEGYGQLSCSPRLQLTQEQGTAAASKVQTQRAGHQELPGKVPRPPPRQGVSGDLQAIVELLRISVGEPLSKLLWEPPLLRAATLERGRGLPTQSGTRP